MARDGAAAGSDPGRAAADVDRDHGEREQIRALVRAVEGFPVPGVTFRDVTTVMRDPVAWSATIEQLCSVVADWHFDAIVGIESRGFILGAPMSYSLGVGFIPVRKPGKLPAAVHAVEYALEYGTDRLEIHQDSLVPGQRVVIVDDLLATGGTAVATSQLVEATGAVVAGVAFMVELTALSGRERIVAAVHDVPVAALLAY